MAQFQQKLIYQQQEHIDYTNKSKRSHSVGEQLLEVNNNNNNEILWLNESEQQNTETDGSSKNSPETQFHRIQSDNLSSEIHIANEINASNGSTNNCKNGFKIQKNKESISTSSQNTTYHTTRQRPSIQQQPLKQHEKFIDNSDDNNNSQEQPNYMEWCVFCQKLNGYDSFNQLLTKALFQKYPLSQNKFYAREVEEILRWDSTPLVIRFRDEECFEIDDEYLKRFYPREQQFKKLFDLTAYYKYHKDIPRLFMLQLGHSMTCYHEHRRKIEYKRITKQLNLENNDDPTENEQLTEDASEEEDNEQNENVRNIGERESSSNKDASSKASKDKKNVNKQKNNKILPKECEHVLENIDVTLSFHERINQQQQQQLQKQKQDPTAQQPSKGYRLLSSTGVENDINAFYFFCQNQTKKQELADGFDAESFARKPSNVHFKPQLKKNAGSIQLSAQVVSYQNNNQIIDNRKIDNCNNNNITTTSSYSLSQLLQNQKSLETDFSVSQINQLLFTEQSYEDQTTQQRNPNSLISSSTIAKPRLVSQMQAKQLQLEHQMMLNFTKPKNTPPPSSLPSEMLAVNNSNPLLAHERVIPNWQHKIPSTERMTSPQQVITSSTSALHSNNQLNSSSKHSTQATYLSTQPLSFLQMQNAQQQQKLQQQQNPQKVVGLGGFSKEQLSMPQTKLSNLILEQQMKNAVAITNGGSQKNTGAQAASAAVARLTLQATQLISSKPKEEGYNQQLAMQSQGIQQLQQQEHFQRDQLGERQQHMQTTNRFQLQRDNNTNDNARYDSRGRLEQERESQQLQHPGVVAADCASIMNNMDILKGVLLYADAQINSNSSVLRNQQLKSTEPFQDIKSNNNNQNSSGNHINKVTGNGKNNNTSNNHSNTTGGVPTLRNAKLSDINNMDRQRALASRMNEFQPSEVTATAALHSQLSMHARTASVNNAKSVNDEQQQYAQKGQEQQQYSRQQPVALATHAFGQSQSDQQLLASYKQQQQPLIPAASGTFGVSNPSKVVPQPISNNNNQFGNTSRQAHTPSQTSTSAGWSSELRSGVSTSSQNIQAGTSTHRGNSSTNSGEVRLKKKKEGTVMSNNIGGSSSNNNSNSVSLMMSGTNNHSNHNNNNNNSNNLSTFNNSVVASALSKKGLSTGVMSLNSERNHSRKVSDYQSSQPQSSSSSQKNDVQRIIPYESAKPSKLAVTAASNSAFFNAKRNSNNSNNNYPHTQQEFLANTQLPYSSPNSSSFFSNNQKNRSASNYSKQPVKQQQPHSNPNSLLQQEIAMMSSNQVKHQNFVGQTAGTANTATATASECAAHLQQLLKAAKNRTEQLTLGSTITSSNNNTNAKIKNNQQQMMASQQQQQQELQLLNKPNSNSSLPQRIIGSQSSHASFSQQPLNSVSPSSSIQLYSQLLQQKQLAATSQQQSSVLNLNNNISPFNQSPHSHSTFQQQFQSQYPSLQNQHQDSQSSEKQANPYPYSSEIINRNNINSSQINSARTQQESNPMLLQSSKLSSQRNPLISSSVSNTPQMASMQQSLLAAQPLQRQQLLPMTATNIPSKEITTSQSSSSSPAHFAESIRRIISQNIQAATSKGSNTSDKEAALQLPRTHQPSLQSQPQSFQLAKAQPSQQGQQQQQSQVQSFFDNANIAKSSSPDAFKKPTSSQRTKPTTTDGRSNSNTTRNNNGSQQQSSLGRMILQPTNSMTTSNNNGISAFDFARATLTAKDPTSQPSSLTSSQVNQNYAIPSNQVIQHLRQQSTQLLSQTARPALNTPLSLSRNNSPTRISQQPQQLAFMQSQQLNHNWQQQQSQAQYSQQQTASQRERPQQISSNYTVNLNSYQNKLPSSLSLHQSSGNLINQQQTISTNRPTSTSRAATGAIVSKTNSLLRFRQS